MPNCSVGPLHYIVVSNLIQITSTFSPDIASQQGFGEKIRGKRVLKKKLKIGGVLDFTADFGLKVRQVSAGFGCGEGY